MQRCVNPGGQSWVQPNALQPDLEQMNSQPSSHLWAITCSLATGTCKQWKSWKHVHEVWWRRGRSSCPSNSLRRTPLSEDVPLAALDRPVGGDEQPRLGPVNPTATAHPPLTESWECEWACWLVQHFSTQWVCFGGCHCCGNARPAAQVGVDVVGAEVSVFNA